MATILDELVSRVEDPVLRGQIAEHVGLLQGNKEYGLSPGDYEWEALGVFNNVTKPRLSETPRWDERWSRVS